MITTLHIKNIGIIEELTIDLNKGLNVLTGETGAGKTLIIDSLSILSGGRFSKEMIRKGESNSYVEACIYLPKNPNNTDENIIVSREINNNGRNLCKINGRMVTVNELKEFMSKIIEIHGQNDNQTLLDNKYHLKYLDGYIGEKLSKKQEYQIYYNKYLELEKKLKEGEEEELEDRKKIIVNAEKIAENLKEADNSLGNNAIDAISIAIRALEKIEDIDPQYRETASNLKSSYYELQEISREISSKREDINFDEEERSIIEERLDIIHDLKRKYGNTISEILQYKQEIKHEIEHIENLEEYTSTLKKEKKEIEKSMDLLAEQIHTIRETEAEELSNKINKELKELEMKNAKIHVRVKKLEEYNKEGKDNVAFYIQTNLGEDEKELSKIASGGEISRTMLGIKKVLADTDEVPILIFDEIDTGISGKAANSVAQKLSHIAKKHQVLCISHLPNIAAIADNNYFISKNVVNERTNTNIKQLNETEILQEIARISSGEINEISLKYAEELRKNKIA